MRFRFCGDLDAPDWLLSEISLLSQIRPEEMGSVVEQVMRKMVGGTIAYDVIRNSNKEALRTVSDVKAVVASVDFILANAAKYDVEDGVLSTEIQQLGLPRESTEILARLYAEGKDRLRKHFKEQSLQVSRFQGMNWRVGFVVASSESREMMEPSVEVRFTTSKTSAGGGRESEQTSLQMTPAKFQAFRAELRAARKLLEGVDGV